MFNNYKLQIYFDFAEDCYLSTFECEFIDSFDNIRTIIREPVCDFFSIEAGEIHIKKKTITSKLLQVMYK